MAHGDERVGKWRGNWRMEWVASTLHTTSEHGVSSITTADAQSSAASSRLNWRPRLFKWTRPFRRKTKSGFRACHHISNAVYLPLTNNITQKVWRCHCAGLECILEKSRFVQASWNVMAHAQKPDFVFRRNGRVHLNRRGRQFSWLLAAEVCESAVVMLDTPCSEVVWRVLATHSIRQFPPSHPCPCVTVCHHISTGVYLGIR